MDDLSTGGLADPTYRMPRHWRMPRRPVITLGIAAILALLSTVLHVAAAAPATPKPLEVAFANCSEFAGITTIAMKDARPVVPSSFTLAGARDAVPFVVRVAHCERVSIAGFAPEAATVAQLGVSVASPDGTGDINNYALWYYTTNARLAVALRQYGVPTQWVPQLRYQLGLDAHSRLSINVAPGRPAFRINSAVADPTSAPVSFTANWWAESDLGRTKMSTPIPALQFGSAATTLKTAHAGDLGQLLHSSTATFAVLDSFNRFATAPMITTLGPRG